MTTPRVSGTGASVPSPREMAVLRALVAGAPGWQACTDVAARAGIPDRTARHHLARLRNARVVQHNGAATRGARWRLPDPLKGTPAAAYLERAESLSRLLFPEGEGGC
ncbi:hypothetical protein [Geodermatophilus sp. SYSU D00700]